MDMDIKKATYNCPFCRKPIPLQSISNPALFVCPVCKAEDKEWMAMFNCRSCGYGHRITECPHCKEDFDSTGFMFTRPTNYLDFMRVSKYKGPKITYRLGDLVFRDSMDFSAEQRGQLEPVFQDLSIEFPEGVQKLKTLELYSMKTDESDDELIWLSAYLYDKYDLAPNQDVGQVVVTFKKGERRVHAVVDVSRNYLKTSQSSAKKAPEKQSPTVASKMSTQTSPQTQPKHQIHPSIPQQGSKKPLIFGLVAVLIVVAIVYFSSIGNKSPKLASACVDKECNLRSSPSKGKNVIKIIPKGGTVAIIENSGEWAKVRFTNSEGYVKSNLLK